MAPKANQSRVSRTNQNGEVTGTDTPFLRMLHDMSLVATAEAENATFNGDTLAAIYNAETDDDIWDADTTGPLNAQHLEGCELALYELAVKYSRGGNGRDELKTPWLAPDGKKMYVLVTAARISKAGEKKLINLPAVGEQFEFNTSAQFLTAKLFTFWSRGRFGNGATMEAAIEGTDIGEGQTVLKLIRVPERVIRVTPEHQAREVPSDVPVSEPPF